MAIQQIFIAPIESYFSFVSQNLLYDAVSKKWLIGESPLKILQQEDTEVLIDNLNKDIANIANNGKELRNSFFNEIAQSIYSQYLMCQYNTQDLIVLYQLYYGCTQYISETLSSWKMSYNNLTRVLETKKQTFIKHDARNVETVVGRGGFAYSELVLKEVNYEIKIIAIKQLIVTHFHDTWKDIEKYTDRMFSIFSIGYKARIGEIDSEMQLKVWVAAEKVSSLMSWRGKNAGTVEEVKNSLKKLHAFINKIEDIGLQSLQRIEHIKKEMVFEDLRLSIGDKELLSVQTMSLKTGMFYALTGDSGTGKSSLLSKIKGITHNGITASGVIKYPKSLNQNEDIVLMPQIDFFPMDVTLLGAIYYPKLIISPLDQKDQIYAEVFAMLQRLELCNGSNNDKNTCDIEEFMKTRKDWGNVLSGGQKKKVLLVSALMQKPKILLLDEPFTGLHQEAISKMQRFIKETLQDTNTLVVCTDHHVSKSTDLYNFDLHIENKTLELRQFPSNTSEKYGYDVEQNFKQCTAFNVNDNNFFIETCPIEEYV